MSRPEVKICGLCRPTDASFAAEYGATYLGVVFAAGSPRRQDEGSAARIWEGLAARRAGVFLDASVKEVIAAAARLSLDVVQLHGTETPDACVAVRGAGDWRVWKVVHVTAGMDLVAALDVYRGAVDGLALEGFSERGAGGVGAAFDWDVASDLRARLPEEIELILAGGLEPGNVAEAVRVIEPDVVDVSSGVESAICEKDPELMRAFMAAARGLG